MEIHKKETGSTEGIQVRRRSGEGAQAKRWRRRSDEGSGLLWWGSNCEVVSSHFGGCLLMFFPEKVSIVFGIALACSIFLLARCTKLLLGQHFIWRPQFQDTIQHLRITSWVNSGLGQITLANWEVGTWKMMIILQKRKNGSKFYSSIQVVERAHCHSPQLL